MKPTEIECPSCKGPVALLVLSPAQWLQGRRRCRACGATLELSNPLVVGGACGLVLGLMALGMRTWLPAAWPLWYWLVGLLWLLLGAAALRNGGRWQAVQEREPAPVRYWTRVLNASAWIGAAAALLTYADVSYQMQHLALPTSALAWPTGYDPLAILPRVVLWRMCAGCGLTIAAIAFAAAASARRAQVRRAVGAAADPRSAGGRRAGLGASRVAAVSAAAPTIVGEPAAPHGAPAGAEGLAGPAGAGPAVTSPAGADQRGGSDQSPGSA